MIDIERSRTEKEVEPTVFRCSPLKQVMPPVVCSFVKDLPLYMFTEGCGFDELVDNLEEDPRMKRYASLNRALSNVLQNYNFVNYQTLNIQVRNDCRSCQGHFSADLISVLLDFDNSSLLHWAIVG